MDAGRRVKTYESERLELSINGVTLASLGHLWRIAPGSVDATITVGQKVGVEEQAVTSVPRSVTIPPFSLSIYSFAVQ